MKLLNIILIGLLLTASLTSVAKTFVYERNNQLVADFNDIEKSYQLYQTLSDEDFVGSSTIDKYLELSNQNVIINCSEDLTGNTKPYTCSVIINFQGLAKGNYIYHEGGFLKATIADEKEAEHLYNLLDVQVLNTKSGDIKIFQTEDRKVELYCIKRSYGKNQGHYCTASLEYRETLYVSRR